MRLYNTIQSMLVIALALVYCQSSYAQCTDNGNYWNNSWTSCQDSSNPNPAHGDSKWIMYEFHAGQNIDGSHIWNANRSGESGSGIQEVIIDYSVDGSTWINLGTYTWAQAPETDTYEGFAGPSFGEVYLQKILFTVVSTFSDANCASLAEVKFETVPGLCNGPIDECGICNGPGAAIWYVDSDGDGLGDSAQIIEDCNQPAGFVSNDLDLCDDGTLGWQDMAVLFVDNTCTSCHGNNATSGLNLLTYSSFMQGGDNCGSAITVGTNLVDIIETGNVSCSNGVVNAAMNINAGFTMDAEELAAIQEWIDSGAPELCTEACPNADACGDCVGNGLEYNIEARLLLEGAYDQAGEMSTHLSDDGLLPLTQPFNRAPWLYNGNEFANSIPANVTDWVLVEIKCLNDPDRVIEQRAAFLRNDGRLLDTDGSVGVTFDRLQSNTDYHLVIRSRNHLAVVASSYVNAPGNLIFDLRFEANVLGANQLASLGNPYYGLKAGDFNSDGLMTFVDFNAYMAQPSMVYSYEDLDCNLDGHVTVADYNLYRLNASAIGVSIAF